MATICVLITTHNRPVELERALASVFGQTQLPAEVVVVDDGSSPAVDQSVFARAPDGLSCRLVRHERPLGANVARNTGLHAVGGEFVAFLDDDDEFLPSKITNLSQVASGDVDLIHHRVEICYDREGISYVSGKAAPLTVEAMLVQNLVGGTSTVCARRDFLLAIGGFDPQMPALQDYETWLRALINGGRFVYIAEVLTRYHFVSGKPAISKNLDSLKRAVRRLSEKYGTEIAQLPRPLQQQRIANNHHRLAQRHAMRGERVLAARAFLKASAASHDFKMLAAAAASLLGLRALLLLRARGGGST